MALQDIWEAVKHYKDYSIHRKEELIETLTSIHYLLYKMDRPSSEWKWSKRRMRQHVLEEWDRRMEEMDSDE